MSGVGGIGGGGAGVQQIVALRQQIIDRSQLLKQLHAPQQGAQAPAANQAPAENFAGTLRQALDGVNTAQAKAADLSAAYQRGEVTDVAQVMLARQEAGIAFEATLQVRNKLLSAYQDIMRMCNRAVGNLRGWREVAYHAFLFIALTRAGYLAHVEFDLDLAGEIAFAQHRGQELCYLQAQLLFHSRLQIEPVSVGAIAFGQQLAVVVDDLNCVGRQSLYRTSDQIDDCADLAV
jgi:flagellar hook-basal body complex protein FliE